MKLPKFRHKTPGFGITKNTYMTVLAAQATLPAISQIVAPKPETGQIAGFGAPLSSNDKDDLHRPLMRGQYVLSTPDKKTLLRMMVLSKEEAGFDPAPFLRSQLAQGLDSDLLARISATWTLMQLTFESHDPMVYDAIRFLLSVCARMAEMSGGVVADPICQTYRLPHEVFHNPQADSRIDARDVVDIKAEPHYGANWVFSYGMQKFNLPELEIFGVLDSRIVETRSLLISLCQKALIGDLYGVGDRVGDRKLPLELGPGGLDRGKWEGIECLELIPPTGKTAEDCIAAWKS